MSMPVFNESAQHADAPNLATIVPEKELTTAEKVDIMYDIVIQFQDLLNAVKPEQIKQQMQNPITKSLIGMFTKNLPGNG